MSVSTSMFVPAASAVDASAIHAPETRHRNSLAWILLIFAGAVVALTLYGQDYYRLSQPERAFSSKHHLLKPGGVVGINLGLLGVVMLCGIFLYPLRKRWRWLQKLGNSKHWLDHHVVLGVAAPVCIALHSSFKFRGLAGLAFWLMVAVSVSGLIGRYLYAQVLLDIAEAELLSQDFQAGIERQSIVRQADLRRLLPLLPGPDRVSRWSPLTASIYMLASDLARPFRIMQLRMRIQGSTAAIVSMLGVGRPRDIAFEKVVRLVRKQALLSRRMLLLSHAKRIFQLWHVVHKPFSYAFGILALLHIGVAMMLGFL
jgi:hypothetical protein